ncbi:MAG TPA: carbohydrate ABC transporter permease [Rhizomicrobium sp.]|jgi:multiple sugar transport system permease protein|nr:carbohydrate ABC transporter permease [Rhizomicrobium sp.]
MTARAQTGRNAFVLAGLVVAAAIMAAPLLWTLALSLKPNAELMRGTHTVFQGPYTLANYADILGHPAVFGWLLNSTVVSLSVTFGVLALSSLAGYGFARLQFPGRDIIFIIVLFGLAIPEQSVIIARHQMFSALHLHNTYGGLILPGLAAPFGVFLMTQYFRAVPKELEEAAWLDGASRFKIFWRILLPLSLPAQATLGIFTFLATWNDYWWPLISATNSEMFTLTVGIASSQMNFAQTNGLGFLMAQAVFASVPILIVYVFFQRYIVLGVSKAAM